MIYPFKKLLTFAAFISSFLVIPIFAQVMWTNNGRLVSGSNATQIHCAAVPDGFGGAFL